MFLGLCHFATILDQWLTSERATLVISMSGGLIVVAIMYLTVTYLRLGHIPGPYLASISNIPRWNWVRGNKAHNIHIALHRKHGRLVRFGPNMVSVADAAEIPNIYSFTGKFPKVRKQG
jgi:hypothetical protein